MTTISFHDSNLSLAISSIEIRYTSEEEDEVIMGAKDGIGTAHASARRTICPSMVVESVCY